MTHDMTTGSTARRTRAQRLAVLALLAPACLLGAPPQRIVSMNVCTDQLLLGLVERERIASLSYIAADVRTSGIADQVDGIPLNRGIAEEIVALAPDLIVTGQFGFRPTVGMLRRLGYVVVELPMADALTDIPQNLRTLGAALGVEARADTLAAAFEHRLARLTYDGGGERPLFVNYDANGWTTGQTGLLADIVHRAGLATPGDRLGFAQSTRLTIEGLVLLRPALIDLGFPWDDPPALASEHRRHPAVQAVLRRTTVVDIPDSTWLCGTPSSLDALERLRSERAALPGDERP